MTISRALLDKIKQIIPPLNGTLHKGQSGRVGVLGGAQESVISIVTIRTHPEVSDKVTQEPRSLLPYRL